MYIRSLLTRRQTQPVDPNSGSCRALNFGFTFTYPVVWWTVATLQMTWQPAPSIHLGGEHTALSYSDCGSEPVTYAVIKVDCAGGLVIEVLYNSDQIDVDVVLPHGGP